MKWGLVLLALCAALSCVSCSAVRCADSQTVRVANGGCVVKLTHNDFGQVIDADTEAPCLKAKVDDKNELGDKSLEVNHKPLVGNTGSITFGTGTTTCYGPPIPSPPVCICTKKPCP
jgi:hypothetical protein